MLEITLNNGLDPRTGKKLGLTTGEPTSFSSLEELLLAFRAQLHYFLDIKIKGNNIIETLYAKYMPAPFLSLVIDDCIKNAKDYNAGGARYNTSYIQGVGIGSITDMLSAIKHHVFEEKTLTMQELLGAMESNFEDMEPVRQMLHNKTPRYGNDLDFADHIMEIGRASCRGRV